MPAADHQTLRVLDGSYVLDRPADITDVDLRADVLAVVSGPDGSTVMRRNDAGEDAWSALWNGDEAHDVQGDRDAERDRGAAWGRRRASVGGLGFRRRPRPRSGRSAG
jgi:hypothetical protein